MIPQLRNCMNLQFLSNSIQYKIKGQIKQCKRNKKEFEQLNCCIPEEPQVSAQGLWGFIDGTQSFFWSSPKMLAIEKEQKEGLLSPRRSPS